MREPDVAPELLGGETQKARGHIGPEGSERADGRQPVATDDDRRLVPEQAVDQIGGDEGGGDRGTALDQDSGDTLPGERRQGPARLHASALHLGRDKDHGTRRRQGPGAGRIGPLDGDDPKRHPAGGGGEAAAGRQTQPRIEHDADRRAALHPLEPAVEQRVVGERGAGADQDRVVRGAVEMGAPPRRRAGDPARRPRRRRDPAVEAPTAGRTASDEPT